MCSNVYSVCLAPPLTHGYCLSLVCFLVSWLFYWLFAGWLLLVLSWLVFGFISLLLSSRLVGWLVVVRSCSFDILRCLINRFLLFHLKTCCPQFSIWALPLFIKLYQKPQKQILSRQSIEDKALHISVFCLLNRQKIQYPIRGDNKSQQHLVDFYKTHSTQME